MVEDPETLQKQVQEALEGKKRAEEREKKLEEQLMARENLEAELKRMREKNDSEFTGFLEEGNIKLEVEVDKVGEGFIYSDYTSIAGLSFRLGCKKEMRGGSMQLPTLLFCNENDVSKTWSALVACTFKLHSLLIPGTTSFHTLFGPSNVSHEGVGYNWDGLVHPSCTHVQNGRLTIEAQIRVIFCDKNSFIDFASPDPQLSDVVLLVGERKIHANRMYLAHYCGYFKVIFCSEFAEKDKKEIELKDIDPDEFEEMLSAIYPQRKKPTAATVTGLLRMADYFDVHVVGMDCADFLLPSTDFSHIAKLQLSEEFRLSELQYRLMESLREANDVKAVIDSADFDKLSLPLKNSLLEKRYKLSG